MAHVNNGTKVEVADNLLPAAYTKPSVTTFNDAEYIQRANVFTVAKSTVEDPVEATTVTQLVSAVDTAYAAQIVADYDTVGLTVTTFAVIRIIVTNQEANASSDIWNDTVNNYLVTTDIYVKTA